MKKILSILLIMTVVLLQAIGLVSAESLSDGITKYEDYITEAISKSELEENQIDKENIFIVELTNPMAIKNNTEPLIIYVALPIIDTEDISYAGFERNEYKAAITNFSSLAYAKNPYGSELKQYIDDNNLSEPTEIKILQIIERLHLFAYYVVCDNTEYIIPYYFTNESNYNITNSDECDLEYGKAYTISEFNSICDKEQILFEEERKKQSESENTDKTHIDDGGEVVNQKNESVKEDEATEKKDTAEEIFTFEELAKISEKEIKKISIACSKNGRTEVATSSPLIISNIVNSVNDIQFAEDTREGSAGGWLYFINFYLEDDTYIQFGTRLYIDKINYIAVEHEAAIEKMAYYHDLIESIDSSKWATDYILESIELGFLEGISELNYKEPVTREKFCEIAFNLLLVTNQGYRFHTENNEVKFTDTDNYKIQDLNRAGIIYGKSETEFAPKDLLTREEAATILYRVAEYIKADMPQSAYDESVPYYADKEAISDWAFDAVFVMKEMGIMVGTSETEFSPKETYTAEQAIATIIRIYTAQTAKMK